MENQSRDGQRKLFSRFFIYIKILQDRRLIEKNKKIIRDKNVPNVPKLKYALYVVTFYALLYAKIRKTGGFLAFIYDNNVICFGTL